MAQLSENKLKLLEMEAEGRFVFHGSGDELEILEPRQAENFIDEARHPDGPPAVFASDKAEYAIFMALVHSRNCPQGYQASSGTENGRLIFRTTQETFAQLGEDARGFVYVLDKNDFTLRDHGGVEYASAVPVKPLEKLLVTRQDLPENVQITH